MDVFVGADLGSSGLKLAVLDAEGEVVAGSDAGYPVDHPHPGWAETDPRAWVAALRSALQQVAPALSGRRVAGLGVDGQMHGLVLCDSEGLPCRPAMLWTDRRAETVLDRWHALDPTSRASLANPLVPGMTGPLLDWLHVHEPQTLDNASVALLPKDFLRVQLGGPPVTDRSDASGTLLWDVTTDGWAVDVVHALGLPLRLLPEVVASDAVVGSSTGLADGTGMHDVALVAGAADTPAALLALGGLPAGELQVNLGTGAQVLRGISEPLASADPLTHLYADADGGWYAMAAIQNAGLALNRVCVMLGLTWEQMFSLASSTAPGAGGISFLPFLTGERGGIAGPSSRGAWMGIDDRTTRADLVRAAVEAMVFAVRCGVDLVGAAPSRVRLTGGGGRRPLVSQMLADCLGLEVVHFSGRSASAVGAAMLAARGFGRPIPVRPGTRAVVGPSRSEALSDAYTRWCEVRELTASRPSGGSVS